MVGKVFLRRYEVVRPLGEGGMGVVYLGRQIDLGRQVVIKVMHDRIAADPKFRERFQRETLLMARFQHPYAVTLYDASLDDPGGPCIIMEYIRGVTLDTLAHRNNGRLNPMRIGRLLGQLCEVLQAAHHQGIIHRDLKPTNLMVVDPDTPYEKIKVMDFGLAKLRDQPSIGSITESGAEFAIGTPAYISPEQARCDPIDHRSDLYSVGVILYELLTGRLPFTGNSTMDVLLAHATDAPPAFAEVSDGLAVDPSLERLIQDCLAKDPANRPQSALDLAQRYEATLAGLSAPRLRPMEQVVVPEPEPAPVPEPPPEPQASDPLAVVHALEAWMPETIATYKLRGFVQDTGGEVLESSPGLIRVRLGGGSRPGTGRGGPFSWLGLGRRADAINMELRLQPDPGRANQLRITVSMRSATGRSARDPAWRSRCHQVFCDLRAYLIGQTGS
jgi:eukaryotic-like serine/threonine-protein kinase